MKISEMITDRYKLRIPPTVYYDLLADVQEVEEEQEPVLDKIRAEIERQEKWLMNTRYNQYNVDIAFDAIMLVVNKYKAESED